MHERNIGNQGSVEAGLLSGKIAETCRVHAGQHKACSSSSNSSEETIFESQKIPTAHSETHTFETLSCLNRVLTDAQLGWRNRKPTQPSSCRFTFPTMALLATFPSPALLPFHIHLDISPFLPISRNLPSSFLRRSLESSLSRI